MRWKAFRLGMIVTAGLIVGAGGPAASWGQSGTPVNSAGNANSAVSTVAVDTATRLPDTDDGGDVTTASADEPVSTGGTNARVAALEAKIAELDAMLQAGNPANKGYVVGSDRGLLGKFTNDGAVFTSKNGDFRWKMRGLCQLDTVGMQNPQGVGQSGTGSPGIPGGIGTQDSTTFRRLRVGAEGTMYETIDWVWEVDLAFALQNVDPTANTGGVNNNGAAPITGLRSTGIIGGVPNNQGGNTISVIQPTTIFMTFTTLPVIGNIRVGNQQDWISLEHIESARFLDFMERAPIMDAFFGPNNNGYTPGISAFNMTPNKRAALEVGIYKNNVYDSGFPYSVGTNALTYNGRATWCPYYDEPSEGRYMLHTGFGAEYRTLDTEEAAATNGDNVRVRSRGDLRNVSSTMDPNFADTGNFFAKSQGVLCPELAFQWGPLLIQAEYAASYFNNAATSEKVVATLPGSGIGLGQVFFQGGYIEALYFLTGENRQYNRQSGVFNRVIPFENYGVARGAGCYGWGAWQVGCRYDWLDLNSGAIKGGNSQNLTCGLNWFLNPNARFQINYVASWFNNMASPLATGATSGYLAGSMFTGSGLINSLGARLDFNF